MLSFVKFLLLLIVVGVAGDVRAATATGSDAREGSNEGDFKAYLKWATENLEATQKKATSTSSGPGQDSPCPTQKCQLKSYQLNNHRLISVQVPTLEQQTTPENPETTASQERILVFVSFSMPEAALKALAQAAEAEGAVLIIRGLLEDSFKITAARLKDLGASIEINPELFEQYGIQHTPTFVRIKDGREQARLSGNVTLKFANAKLREVS